jgi:hypothetical protein
MGLLNLDGIKISPLEQVAGGSIPHRDSEVQRTAEAFIADDNGIEPREKQRTAKSGDFVSPFSASLSVSVAVTKRRFCRCRCRSLNL